MCDACAAGHTTHDDNDYDLGPSIDPSTEEGRAQLRAWGLELRPEVECDNYDDDL